MRSCRTSCWRCQGVLWSPTGFLPPHRSLGFSLWLWVNRWGWVFPCSIFNPRLNLKRFQRSLQTIVSVTSKQILPLPPFVSPHLPLLSSHNLNLRVCWLPLHPETFWVHPQLQNRAPTPNPPAGAPGPPSFSVCVHPNIQEGQTDPGCCCQERKYLSFIPHLCVDSPAAFWGLRVRCRGVFSSCFSTQPHLSETFSRKLPIS